MTSESVYSIFGMLISLAMNQTNLLNYSLVTIWCVFQIKLPVSSDHSHTRKKINTKQNSLIEVKHRRPKTRRKNFKFQFRAMNVHQDAQHERCGYQISHSKCAFVRKKNKININKNHHMSRKWRKSYERWWSLVTRHK